MKDPKISVVIPCHNEQAWLQRAIKSVLLQVEPPDFELILVADKPSVATHRIANETAAKADGCRILLVDNGDLGASRNDGIKAARGEFVSFLDADDMFGATWLRAAYEYAKMRRGIFHPEWSVMFGAKSFVHHHIASDNPAFDARDMIQYNQWSALAFARKDLFERFPYERANKTFAFEDWQFNAATLGAGETHHCVPDTSHIIRMKLDHTSLAARMTEHKATVRAMPLFDNRDLPEPRHVFQAKAPGGEIQKQILFAHHQVGEYQLLIGQDTEVRHYPRQKVFADQGWLKDQVKGSKNVILVRELLRGGAERYAMDIAQAHKDAGRDVTIIETDPGESPWLEEARKICNVVQWRKRKDLEANEVAYALQRALIQCELDTLWNLNSEVGWALIHEHTDILAKRVIAASFAPIPVEGGYISCPPFHMRRIDENLRFLTDNERHADRLRSYLGTAAVTVIPPRSEYAGSSKRRQVTDKRLRVLWAGRGSPEKQPGLVPGIAQKCQFADFHVWGDVPKVSHSLPNLHYRGAFDGFANIEGSYDCYLMTSLTEGMPHTALEAVRAGLPVISSNVGDLSRIAADTFTMERHNSPNDMILGAESALARLHTGQLTPRTDVLDRVLGWTEQFNAKIIAMAKE